MQKGKFLVPKNKCTSYEQWEAHVRVSSCAVEALADDGLVGIRGSATNKGYRKTIGERGRLDVWMKIGRG